VKSGFLNDYLAGLEEDQGHEIPVHDEVHTIAGGFLKRKVHRFSAEEVCTSSDVGRGVRG